MRKRYWLMMVPALVVGVAAGMWTMTMFAIADANCLVQGPPCTPEYNYDMDMGSVTMGGVGAIMFMLLFMAPMIIREAWKLIHPQEADMAHIESVKGTVKFDDECLEYDFIHAVRQHPEVQTKFYESIEAWKSHELIADDMRGELWITTLDAIPQPGIHRKLFGRYLESLDWDEIATYYIEQYEQERASE